MICSDVQLTVIQLNLRYLYELAHTKYCPIIVSVVFCVKYCVRVGLRLDFELYLVWIGTNSVRVELLYPGLPI